MDQFRSDQTSLPKELYRVQYPGCQTSYSPALGLHAKDTSTFYSENQDDAFRLSIIHQFTWGWRQPTPYISVFSDKTHAENWALSHSKRTGSICEVRSIDTQELRDVYVFQLKDLEVKLKCEIPEKASQHIDGAYLCLHHIPNGAISLVTTTQDIEDGMQSTLLISPRP